RLERMREDARRDEQELTDRRARLEADEAAVQQQLQEDRRLRAELDNEKELRDAERRRFEERGTLMEAAVVQFRQVQEKLSADEHRLSKRAADLDTLAAAQAEEAALLQARTAQLQETQERVAADRKALREREASLAQAEHAREVLQ